jgi:hypothetical protein
MYSQNGLVAQGTAEQFAGRTGPVDDACTGCGADVEFRWRR